MKTAVCAIIAPFDIPYLAEWTRWHFRQGFDVIHLYLNDWSVDDLAFVKNTDFGGEVRFKIWDGPVQQLPAYNDFIDRFKDVYDWAAFIDIDEFIVPKLHKNVREMLEAYQTVPQLALNWKLFGSNGLKDAGDGDLSCIRRFTRSQTGVNKHIKTLVNLYQLRNCRLQVRFLNPHFTNSVSFSPEMRQVIGPFNPAGSDKIAYLAHFATKSEEECRLRRSRRRADMPVPREDWKQFFAEHDRNEEENLDLMNFYK